MTPNQFQSDQYIDSFKEHFDKFRNNSLFEASLLHWMETGKPSGSFMQEIVEFTGEWHKAGADALDMAHRILNKDREAQLSSKEQDLKELNDKYAELWGDWNREQFSQRLDELASLRAENQDKYRLLIEYRKLLDPILDWGQTEGLEHGLKLGESITTAVLNRAKEYNQLRKRCEDLEAQNQQLKLKVVEDAVRFAMYMSGKTTIGHQDYFKRSFEAGYYKTWKIDN